MATTINSDSISCLTSMTFLSLCGAILSSQCTGHTFFGCKNGSTAFSMLHFLQPSYIFRSNPNTKKIKNSSQTLYAEALKWDHSSCTSSYFFARYSGCRRPFASTSTHITCSFSCFDILATKDTGTPSRQRSYRLQLHISRPHFKE